MVTERARAPAIRERAAPAPHGSSTTQQHFRGEPPGCFDLLTFLKQIGAAGWRAPARSAWPPDPSRSDQQGSSGRPRRPRVTAIDLIGGNTATLAQATRRRNWAANIRSSATTAEAASHVQPRQQRPRLPGVFGFFLHPRHRRRPQDLQQELRRGLGPIMSSSTRRVRLELLRLLAVAVAQTGSAGTALLGSRTIAASGASRSTAPARGPAR